MKLYYFFVAPNPTKVRLHIAEKKHAGTDMGIEEVLVDFRKNEQNSPEHVARNPQARLPVLELDDGTYLTESLPIMHYLEELFPEPPMTGTTPLERAQTLTVERIAEQGALYPIARVVHATKSPLGYPPNPAVAELFREAMIKPLELLDERLADGRPFLMGDHPTIADCTLQAALQMGRMAEVVPAPSLEHLARWDAAYRERPAAKDVLIL